MKTKKNQVGLLIVLGFLIGNFIVISQVNAITTDYLEAKTNLKFFEDELENLDKVLKVFISCPDEIDLNHSLNVVVAGLRLGKAVIVKPDTINITLSDMFGFVMASREYVKGSTDAEDDVINIYDDKIFKTVLPPIESTGIFTVKASMSYTAPWGEKISGFSEKTTSIQSWFNITAIIQGGKEATQDLLDTAMGGAANIIRDVATETRKIAAAVAEFSISIKNMADIGTIDPAELVFFPILIDDGVGTFYDGSDNLNGYLDSSGEQLDALSNYQDFVKSLDVLVEKRLPFKVYTIETKDQLVAFSEGLNNTFTELVNDENPDASGFYLSYDPEIHTPADWTSGSGRADVSAITLPLDEKLPYRNILINMYENWFPIVDDWDDYRNNVKEDITYGNSDWNASRWLKAITAGMFRNWSLFYNIKGEPFVNFFDISGSATDVTDYDGFNRFNDYAVFYVNQTRDTAALGWSPNMKKYWGEKIDHRYRTGLPGEQSHLTTGWYDIDNVRMDGDGIWTGTFFNGTAFDTYEEVENNAFMIHDEYVTLNAYQSAMDSAAVGLKLSPVCGFGWTAIKNVTVGFEMLHGLYYKSVLNSLKLNRGKIADAITALQERIFIINDTAEIERMTTWINTANQLSNEMYDAWYGTEANNKADRLDLPRLNDAFMNYTETFFTDFLPYAALYQRDANTYLTNISEGQYENAVSLDESLSIAGKDIHFDYWGEVNNWFDNAWENFVLGCEDFGDGWRYFKRGDWDEWSDSTDRWFDHGLDYWGQGAADLGKAAEAGVEDIIKWVMGDIVSTIRENFALFDQMWNTVEDLKDDIVNAIQNVLGIIEELFLKTADALDNIADTIDDIKDFINDFIEITANMLINQTNALLDTLSNLKSDVLQSTGFYFQVKDSMYKMIEQSEFAAGILRFASEEFGITDEIFFKEIDVLRPLSLMQMADTGLYIAQIGTEAVDQIFYVTMHEGTMVNVDSINATYQSPSISPILMGMEQAVDDDNGPVKGLYIGDFGLATKRDWKTQCEVSYVTEKMKLLEVFTVERTTKIIPSLQPDAYPEIDFDADKVSLRTGENYVLHIGIDNLMYSKPNVTIRAELIGTFGTLVGLSEQMVELNEEGEDAVFIDLEANIPFYIPPGEYKLIVKVVEDNGDVTRVVHKVDVSADNFIFAFIGTILSLLGIGVVYSKTKHRKKPSKDIVLARSGKILQSCSLEQAKLGLCVQVHCDDMGNCSL